MKRLILHGLSAFLVAAAFCAAPMLTISTTSAFAESASQANMKACDDGYAAYKAANPVPAGETAKEAYRAYLSGCLKTPTPPPAPVPVDPTPSPTPDPSPTPPDNPTPSTGHHRH